jgi:anti-sigma factor RsiW
MNCNRLVELVTDYLEGTLDPYTTDRFEAHLEECDGCVAYIEQMRATVTAIGKLSETSLQPRMRDRLLAAFDDWVKG